MPLSHKLLLIDDDEVGVSLLADTFRSKGFLVQTALTGVEGVQLAEAWKPALIILDLRMPEMDGFAVCQMLRSTPATANIQILILTAWPEENNKLKIFDLGANDYLTRPYSVAELVARVQARLRDCKENYQCEVSITYDIEQTLSCRISGALVYNGDGRHVSIDLNELNQELADMGDRLTAFQKLWAESPSPQQREDYRKKRDVWKRQAKKKGRQLYDQIIVSNSDLVTHLKIAAEKVRAENVLIRFVGPRAHLGLPWEFLHDGQRPLFLDYPTSRLISGLSLRDKQESWHTFLESPGAKPLRVLLLASNAGTPLEEIRRISQRFKQEFGERVVIEPDPPIILSREQAEKLLDSKSYHLIHYAGHSQFNATQPDRSELKFGPGAGEVITPGGLFSFLQDSAARFVFFNSCAGAQVGNPDQLSENDYLGLLDAAVLAGVPAALGFRWDVTNGPAMKFAERFYKNLFDTQSFEMATWQTRCEIYRSPEGSWDETWESPILVVQNS